MKRTVSIVMSIMVLAFLSSCEKEVILSVDQQLLTFTESGGSQILSLTANKPWTVSSDQSWCKVTPTAGEEATSSRISINCDPNTTYDTRYCTITFTCAELTKTVSVTQDASEGMLIPQTDFDISNEAQQVSVEIKANVKFSVSVDEACKSWIRHSATKSLTTSTVILDISKNEDYDGREGHVTISQTDGSLFSTIKIRQSQNNGLFVMTSDYELSNESHQLSVEVKSNIDFEVSSGVSWIKYVETKSLNTSFIVLDIEANQDYAKREGKVYVKQLNGSTEDSFIVKQAGKNTITAAFHDFAASSVGDSFSVDVESTVEFDVVIPKDAIWLTQIKTKAPTTKTLSFQVATNKTTKSRVATIQFVNTKEGLSDTLLVEQNPVNVPVNNEILYTSTDGAVVNPYQADAFNSKLVSNSVVDRKGSIRFDKEIKKAGNQAFYNRTNLVSIFLPEGVEEIGESAFDNCLRLETVLLPRTIKKIGRYPFKNCRKLKGLGLPNDLTSIPDGLLYGCSSVDSLIMPNSVTEIGKQVFYECSSIKTIVLPKSYAGRIEGEMFSKCSKLEAIELPEGITYIAPSAFSECSKLKTIELPQGITVIEYETFFGCSSLASIKLPESLIEIGNQAFMRCSSLESIKIPNSVSKLGYGAFRECVKLVNANLPDGLTRIPDHLFYQCYKLKDITIPEGVSFIGHNAFNACESFTTITIPEGVETIENEVFQGCKNLAEVKLPSGLRSIGYFSFAHCVFKTIDIPSGVTYIESHAFRECPNLENISLPDGITVIKNNTFYDCPKLATVNVPKNLTTLEYGAFNQCYSLKNISIPEGVTRIEANAFSQCRGLETITIPSTVGFLGNDAFNGCSGLKEIKSLPSTPPTCENNGAFYNTSGCPIYVPKSSVEAYKTAGFWKDWAHRIQALP